MIRIGARNSPLARAQADAVADALLACGVETEFVPIRTQGDIDRRELTTIGGSGVFTAAVRDALLDGRVDIGVHSCKDLPTAAVEGLDVAAYPTREDSHDILVGLRLSELAASGPIRIGTGAPRRAVQLEQLAADSGFDIGVEPVRGNVDTRLDLVRTGKLDAVVLAAAGLRRLGRISGPIQVGQPVRVADLPAEVLSYEQVLPAPGQGALAVETASSLDSEIRRVLTRLDDAVTRAEVLAERRFLAVLEAGCTAPVGARAEVRTAHRRDPSGDAGPDTVRDPGADLTLVAVIGRTREEDQEQQGSNRRASGRPASDYGGPDHDTVVSRGRLITISGSGSSADPEELGSRLASLALTMVDGSQLAPAGGGDRAAQPEVTTEGTDRQN